MERIFSIAALAIVAAIACMVLQGRAGELSLMVSLAGIVVILISVLHVFSPILALFQSMQKLSGMSDQVTGPMLKVAGIGILTQITSSVCEDAGEKTLSQAVEIGGGFLALYAGLPLLSSVVLLLEETLG